MDEQFVCFSWANENYAVCLTDVIRILANQQPFLFQSQKPWLKGVLVYQEKLVGVVDLAMINNDCPQYYVVMSDHEDYFAFKANMVWSVVKIPAALWQESSKAPYRHCLEYEGKMLYLLESGILKDGKWKSDSFN